MTKKSLTMVIMVHKLLKNYLEKAHKSFVIYDILIEYTQYRVLGKYVVIFCY